MQHTLIQFFFDIVLLFDVIYVCGNFVIILIIIDSLSNSIYEYLAYHEIEII